MAGARPLRTRALGWLAVLAPLLGLVYFGVLGQPASSMGWAHRLLAAPWTAGPYLAVPVLLAWSLLWSRSSHELRRQGARLFTALLSGTALTWAAALGGAYAPQHAPALHLALVVVLWDWFGRRIHTPGKRLLLHTAALWAAAAAWTSHEAPPDDVATDVVLGALAGVVSVWLWPLSRRASRPETWRWSRDPQRQRLAALHAVARPWAQGQPLAIEKRPGVWLARSQVTSSGLWPDGRCCRASAPSCRRRVVGRHCMFLRRSGGRICGGDFFC